MPKADNFGNIAPCSKWQGEGKDDLPGYQYNPGSESPFHIWDFPCVTYDINNPTSQKEAMKAAKLMGLEQMMEINKELEKDAAMESFRKSVQRDD